MTTNFAKPGSRKVPLFFISLWPTLTRDSRTPLTSFLLSPSCSAAIFSINWDFDIIATISFGCPDIRKSNREMQQQVDSANTATGIQTAPKIATQSSLEPVDRAKEIPLSDRYAAMTQDVVRGRYKEEEIRQGELLQIIVAFHFPVVGASGPGDDLVLGAVHLCTSQRLHEA